MKKDAVVAFGCIVFVVVNLGAIGSGGRERAKRAVCLSNLRKLTVAWAQFAHDNLGLLVNGEATGNPCTASNSGSPYHEGEKAWAGPDYALGEESPEECQKAAIMAGALWPYCGNLKLYRCPIGYPEEMRNYSIVDGMNGRPQPSTIEPGLWTKNIVDIRRPRDRAVFIDEGRDTGKSYSVHYDRERWYDNPPVRHSDGTTLSFADGHTEYWKWEGSDTIGCGRRYDRSYVGYRCTPVTPEGKEDLHRLQIAVWGRLGYTP